MDEGKIIIELQGIKNDIKNLRDDFSEYKKTTQPMLEIYKTSKNLGKFLLWAGGIVGVVVGALLAIKQLLK